MDYDGNGTLYRLNCGICGRTFWSNDAFECVCSECKGNITIDMVNIVRCKNCDNRGKSEKCVLSAISEEKNVPLFMLDNHGEWYCADGIAKDINVPNKEGR